MPHIVGKLFLFGHGATETITYLFHLAKQSQLVFLYLLDSRNCLRSFGQEGAHDASMTWWPFFCSITRESFHQFHCPQSPIRRWWKKAARIFYQFVWQSINLPLHLHGEIGSYTSIKLHTFKSYSCFHIPWYYLRFNLCGEISEIHGFLMISGWLEISHQKPINHGRIYLFKVSHQRYFPSMLRRRDGSNRISTTGFIKTAWFLSACGRNTAKGALLACWVPKIRGGWK